MFDLAFVVNQIKPVEGKEIIPFSWLPVEKKTNFFSTTYGFAGQKPSWATDVW